MRKHELRRGNGLGHGSCVRKNPKPKARHRLRNWREYNTALVRRGSLTLWCDPVALAGWVERARSGRQGRPRTYSEAAIRCMGTLQQVFHLPLRATVGFVASLLALLGHRELPVAHAATLCRRRRRLAHVLPVRVPRGPLHLVVDATGLKVFGEGEWKVRQHGWERQRQWIKATLSVDAATHELRGLAVTAATVAESTVFPALLATEQAPVDQVTADGAFTCAACYAAVAARPEHPRAVFPPRRERRAGRPPRPPHGGHPVRQRATPNAKYSNHIRQHGNCAAPPLAWDEHVRRIRQIGRAGWKQEVHYHQRSLAETAIFRLKQLFGPGVAARGLEAQCAIVLLRAVALNRMTWLGMPDSYKVPA